MPNWRLMRDDQLQEQLERAKNAIIPIEEEIKRRENLTPRQKLSEHLHKNLCRLKDCGWYYEEAGDYKERPEHQKYEQQAANLINIYGSYENAMQVLDTIFV